MIIVIINLNENVINLVVVILKNLVILVIIYCNTKIEVVIDLVVDLFNY